MHSFGPCTQPLLRTHAVQQTGQVNADLLQQRRGRRAQLVAVAQFRAAGPGGPQLRASSPVKAARAAPAKLGQVYYASPISSQV